jgi:hypothetical protein
MIFPELNTAKNSGVPILQALATPTASCIHQK